MLSKTMLYCNGIRSATIKPYQIRFNSTSVYLVDGIRTPIGSFKGKLKGFKSTELGSIAVKNLIERTKIPEDRIDCVYFGNVIQANSGQAPARQIALNAGLRLKTITTTVNKVCASGMKAIMFAAQHIMLNPDDVLIAGGCESMSNVPYYMEREDPPYGGVRLIDGILKDGLTDAYEPIHMGVCGENTSKKLNITRKQQDDFAVLSYKRSMQAADSKLFEREITPITIKGKRGASDTVMNEDEEIRRAKFDKFASLPTVFDKANGTITAANSSKLSDGAAACLLMSEKMVKELNVQPLARIVGFEDGALAPIDFPIAPVEAIKKLLKNTNVSKDEILRWEINEAFSCVVLANEKLLGLNPDLININGGAVSLGHPIGMSGARIVNSLAHHLRRGEKGVAAICNGGGGSSSIMLEAVSDRQCSADISLPILKFYTKPDCELCDEALNKLRPIMNSVRLQKVDISLKSNEKWFNRYRYEIPVIRLVTESGNDIVMRNREINLATLRDYLDDRDN